MLTLRRKATACQHAIPVALAPHALRGANGGGSYLEHGPTGRGPATNVQPRCARALNGSEPYANRLQGGNVSSSRPSTMRRRSEHALRVAVPNLPRRFDLVR